MALALSILGPFQIRFEDRAIPLSLAPARALLAYLAAESRRPHEREVLAALLWPDQSQAAAFANLRQTLARTRKALAEHIDLAALLAITPQSVGWNHGSATVDLLRFEQLLAECAAHQHTSLLDCQPCIGRLAEAVELYRGELLHGLFLDHSQPFEEWLLVKREYLHRQALDALHTLTIHAEAIGDYEQMRGYAVRQITLEPWREEAHRQVMRALAYRGERAAALAAYETCRRVLDQEFGVEPAVETLALYEQIKAGLLQAIPASPARPLRPPLPVPPTALVGRAEELALIVARLGDPACQLITLTGPGGVGKTHLGLEVARILETTFDDGAIFVPLATITEPDQVLPTIASALQVSVSPDQPLFSSLVTAIAGKRMLLVLDNLEQVLGAAPDIGNLLAHAPQLKLLVTSRAALRVRAEYEIAVAPLALPKPPWTMATIARYPSVALFVQRAQAIMPALTLNEANTGAIVEICTRLDGLPLAIELAAARIRLLPPQALAQRLTSRLDLLRGGMKDLPARHQTLRTTVDWSYKLLAPHEQRFFARLAVFVGGTTLEAAEAICRLGDEQPIDVLDGLQVLVDNSLLRQIAGVDDVPRFTMLETIREYALERLLAGGEDQQIRTLHAAFYMALAEHASPHLAGGTEQIAWFGRIDAELDNLRAALRWTTEHGDAATALRLGTALREFWMTRAYLDEGRRWLEAALALDNQATHHVDDTLRGSALTTAGWLAANQRDYPAAERLFEQSLALARRNDDQQQIIAVLGDLGQAARMQSDSARASALYEERVRLGRKRGDDRSVAWSLCNLGIIAHAEGVSRAAVLLEEGIALAKTLGDQVCLAWCMTFLARVAKDGGDYAQSAAMFAETLAIFHGLGHEDGIAFTLEGRAGLAASQGEFDQAARLFGAADTLRERINRQQTPYDRDIEAVAAVLDTPTWRAAWTQGRALSTEDAIGEAGRGVVS